MIIRKSFFDKKILIIVPAYNEEATISNIISLIKGRYNLDVLVVDDCSQDNTRDVSQKAGAAVLSHCINCGAWCAIQTGFRYALNKGYDIAVTMDADGQHLPEYIPFIIKPLEDNDADLTIGSYTGRGSAGRKFAWSFFRIMSGLSIMDLTSGFRAYNKKTFKYLIADESLIYDYQDIGIILFMLRCGMRVKEVPVLMEPRQNGCSRIFSSWWNVLSYMIDTSFIALTKRLFRDRRHLMCSVNNFK
jgi:glycosyltransferase involved in cell wall biosynthesis